MVELQPSKLTVRVRFPSPAPSLKNDQNSQKAIFIMKYNFFMNKYKDVFITTTDTVMGIGVPISKSDGSEIFELKKRSKTKNLIIAIGSLTQARKFKDWNSKAEKYAKKYWPGNVTLIVSPNLALRIPNNNKLINFLLEKGPCYLTSANISGQPPIENMKDAKKLFKEVKHFYDFGQMSGKPSTIIDINKNKVLR